MLRDYEKLPGLYAAGLYINGMVADAALQKTSGRTDDSDALIKALRGVAMTDTPRGPFHFRPFRQCRWRHLHRRCERKGGNLVNTTIKTYNNVSQFWTYDEKWFLAQPVYSRDSSGRRLSPPPQPSPIEGEGIRQSRTAFTVGHAGTAQRPAILLRVRMRTYCRTSSKPSPSMGRLGGGGVLDPRFHGRAQ